MTPVSQVQRFKLLAGGKLEILATIAQIRIVPNEHTAGAISCLSPFSMIRAFESLFLIILCYLLAISVLCFTAAELQHYKYALITT